MPRLYLQRPLPLQLRKKKNGALVFPSCSRRLHHLGGAQKASAAGDWSTAGGPAHYSSAHLNRLFLERGSEIFTWPSAPPAGPPSFVFL